MIIRTYRSGKPVSRTGRCALVLASLLAAAGIASADVPPMNFVYTYHAFALDGGETMVQFDYQFNGNALSHPKGAGGSVGKLYLRLRMLDTAGAVALETDWITTHAGRGDVDDYTLMGRKLLAMTPGAYRGQIYFQDMYETSRRDSSEFALTVPALPGKKIGTSDVVILAEMEPSTDTTDPFHKSGYRMIPNVESVIAPPFLVLNTYAEIYNANTVPTTEYTVIYALADSTGRVFYRKDINRARPSAAAVIETNTLTLEELPSGDYYLVLQVYDGLFRSARDSSRVLRRFALINPDRDSVLAARRVASGAGEQVVDPIFAGMKDSELDDEFATARFIAIAPEKDMWDQLAGADAKARFLTAFWEKRDPTPGTPENEARKEYAKRVDRARAQFSSGMTPKGWDSDRGRIMLTYGIPDGIDRHPQDYNRRPYEVWRYNGIAYEFVFVDRNQTGTYTLVHSNAPGETSFEDWENEYARVHQFRNSRGWGD